MIKNLLKNVIDIKKYNINSEYTEILIPNGSYFLKIYPKLNNNTVFKGFINVVNTDTLEQKIIDNIEIMKIDNEIIKNNNKIILLTLNSDNNNNKLVLNFKNLDFINTINVNNEVEYNLLISKIG